MKHEIKIRDINQSAYDHLIESGVDPLLARLYAARKIQTISETEHHLRSLIPFNLLSHIQEAVIRLSHAIKAKQRILIVADYDTDGATACALGIKGLTSMGARVDFIVPNRFENGYGLTPEIVEMAYQQQTDLLLTVDNGIASIDGVNKAKELGIDVLITDHHLPADLLPDCIIVNPNQPNDIFPSKSIAGVGVMFYVLMALRCHLRDENYFTDTNSEPNLAQWLDLVALGTVADVVSLDQNNRILVSQGLKRIRQGKTSFGIKALFNQAKRNITKAKTFDLSFAIAPRLNAAGRLDDMTIGIECLISHDEQHAHLLAQQLNELNQERRHIESDMLEEALANLPDTMDDSTKSAVLFNEAWHQGVVGIVASRLKDLFHRPCIIFAPADNGEIRGSGRSISGLHLRDALDHISKENSSLIKKFGGHAMAAGLTINQADFNTFKKDFEKVCQQLLSEEDLKNSHLTDGSFPTEMLDLQHTQKLEEEIWGQGFNPPSFTDIFDVKWQRLVGTNHLKAGLFKEGHEFEAMFFRCTETLPSCIKVVYRSVVNEWREQQELQLYIDYWEPVYLS